MPKDGYKCFYTESGAVTTETGFCAVSGKVSAGAHSGIYTSGSSVQHTECDFFAMPQDNALTIKTQVAKVASSPTCRV